MSCEDSERVKFPIFFQNVPEPIYAIMYHSVNLKVEPDFALFSNDFNPNKANNLLTMVMMMMMMIIRLILFQTNDLLLNRNPTNSNMLNLLSSLDEIEILSHLFVRCSLSAVLRESEFS